MKRFEYRKYGGPEVLESAHVADPSVPAGHVLVRVAAASINPVDVKVRSGAYRLVTGWKFPRAFGIDFSGTVERAEGGFQAGDRVYGVLTSLRGRQGALSELITAEPEKLRHIPAGMSLEQAAAMPVAALTAVSGWRKTGILGRKRVLVNGATGGVGHFAVQIAAAEGAEVTAVTSARNMDLARELGAMHTWDYAEGFHVGVREKFDVIFDAAAKLTVGQAWQLLNRSGMYLTTLYTPSVIVPALLRRVFSTKRAASANMRDLPEDWEHMEELFAEKRIRPIIEQTYPFDRAVEAVAVLEAGKVRGKVVVTLQNRA